MQDNDIRDLAYALLGFCFGIGSFFWGFKRLRRRRLIENIPTSTVRSLAMGLVELSGRAEKTPLLKSPLTKTECVLYKYLVEEYRRSGKHGRWVKIAGGDSFAVPFWLNDGTGKIMVHPQGAELELPVDYAFRTDSARWSWGAATSSVMPDHLAAFLEENGIRYKGWLGTVLTLRFQEWFVRPGDTVYVLGSTRKTDASQTAEYKNALMRRIDELKENSQRMKEVDADRDGEISMAEWDAAVARLEQEVFEEAVKAVQAENPADVVIGKGEEEPIFMISDCSEKELTGKLAKESLLGIYGGAALSLACLAYLCVRLGSLWQRRGGAGW